MNKKLKNEIVKSQFNPFSLVTLLSPRQQHYLAGSAYTGGRLLFNKSRHKDYEKFLVKTFKDLFASDAFLLLDDETRSEQQNMAVELISFLSRVKALDKKVTNQVVRNVMRRDKEEGRG